jgi:YggT family protein
VGVVCTALQLYLYVVFARIIFSYFPVTPGTALESINDFLRYLTEPVLAPLRRAIPPVRLGAMALDLSPLILLIGIPLIVMPLIGC